MKLDSKLVTGLNEQLTLERYSSAVYLAMSGVFEAKNLVGIAKWFRKKSGEEDVHAGKFFDYIADRGMAPYIDGLQLPDIPGEADALVEFFWASLKHEQRVSASIFALLQGARDVKDEATIAFLLPFAQEQVEEEKTVEEMVTLFTLADNDGAAILLLNDKLGA